MQHPRSSGGRFKTPKRRIRPSSARNHVTKFKPSKLLRIGSLCTGYGGLDMAVMQAFSALRPKVAWVAENNRHASTLLAKHFPHAPNLGDVKQIDWNLVDPVDVVCAGFPCQDISYAGLGAGIKH